MIRRETLKNKKINITFALPEDAHAGAVSVVGDFNDWEPGALPLRKRSNGTRSAAVTIPTGSPVRFRYLGEGGHWFDDTDADVIDHDGGLLHV
jgi:hypothetical protein